MEWYIILMVIGAGLLAGFINTLAGSGSLVSLPLLIFLGLDPNTANGTNRIAILLQNIVGVGSFHKEKQIEWKTDIRFAFPALLGAIIGSLIAVEIDEDIMGKVIGIVMIIMLVVILLNPKKLLKDNKQISSEKIWLKYIVFFFVGIYGGFIQAGVGIFILLGIAYTTGINLVRANAVKLLIILLYTPIALAIFIYFGQVNWKYGLILAVGNMIGAFLGTKVAIKQGPKFIRWVLIGIIIISAGKLLFF